METEEVRNKRILILLILGIMLILATPAATAECAEITLTVEQDFEIQASGTEKIRDTGEYRLRAVSTNAPMPEKSSKGDFFFYLNGNNNKTEIPLKFTENGTFVYTLQQTTGDQKNYTYDRCVYTITVYVKCTGDARNSCFVIVKNKKGEKCSELRFHNSFRGNTASDNGTTIVPEKPNTSENFPETPVKTGDASNVNFWLMAGAAALAAAVTLIRAKRIRIS